MRERDELKRVLAQTQDDLTARTQALAQSEQGVCGVYMFIARSCMCVCVSMCIHEGNSFLNNTLFSLVSDHMAEQAA